jgi:lipopolysaccharide heptosyltransferase II
LAVAKAIGLPVDAGYAWLPERPAVTAEIRRKWNVNGARWVVFCPGARWDNKQWPLHSFSDLARQLLRDYQDVRVVVLGGREDASRGSVLHDVAPDRVLDLTGCTSLAEMIEWIRLSQVVVTNDTGPMHVAAAMQKPIVAFFGPTAPERTGPYGQIEQVLRLSLPCAPCLQRRCHIDETLACLRGITPQTAAVRTAVHLS